MNSSLFKVVSKIAYGNRFGIVPSDNDKCHGDELQIGETTEEEKAAEIDEIDDSLRSDDNVWCDIGVDVHDHKSFIDILKELDTDMVHAAYRLRVIRDAAFKKMATKEYNRDHGVEK